MQRDAGTNSSKQGGKWPSRVPPMSFLTGSPAWFSFSLTSHLGFRKHLEGSWQIRIGGCSLLMPWLPYFSWQVFVGVW